MCSLSSDTFFFEGENPFFYFSSLLVPNVSRHNGQRLAISGNVSDKQHHLAIKAEETYLSFIPDKTSERGGGAAFIADSWPHFMSLWFP